MFIHRFARHKQMHDFARPLEDSIDPAIAQHALDADGRFAAPLERACGFVTATAANLQRAVDDLPLARGVPLLRGGGFEPDVVTSAVAHLAGTFARRLLREG